jgi:drug/metabolite transporter (DMT)-like permease
MVARAPLGYAMVAFAATLFAVNGIVSKVILGSGIDSQQLTELRCAGACAGLTVIALVTRPASLRLHRDELPLIVALGVGGLALVQWSYFYAIHRIGIALVVQFVGPILVALWARFVYGEHVRARIWLALVLALTGLLLIVELWKSDRPDAVGLAAAAVAAVTYAAYILLAERGVRRRDPISLSAWGFLFATLFWSVLAPWWNFPAGRVDDRVSLLGNLAARHLPVWSLMA